MRLISADDIAHLLTYRMLIEALDDAFREEHIVPTRQIYTLQPSGEAILALMPAWTASSNSVPFVGCKIATMFPDNAAANKPSIYGSYLLLSGETGEPLAVIDGRVLTAWRTAAASALAASYLARLDATRLLMVGAGALAPHLIQAHCSVRNIEHICLWSRTRARADATAHALAESGIKTTVVDDLKIAVGEADLISCATPSRDFLIRGEWIKPGTHLDLVGGFTQQMREADDEAVKLARVYVDTRAAALAEAGDIAVPLRRGVIKENDICGDLFDLCRGTVKGRIQDTEITMFKSVGSAIEDLAAAKLVWNRMFGSKAADKQ